MYMNYSVKIPLLKHLVHVHMWQKFANRCKGAPSHLATCYSTTCDGTRCKQGLRVFFLLVRDEASWAKSNKMFLFTFA